jgi:hypothetical protein
VPACVGGCPTMLMSGKSGYLATLAGAIDGFPGGTIYPPTAEGVFLNPVLALHIIPLK